MFDDMTVTVPEGKSGDVSIRRMVAGPPSLRDLIRDDGRMVPEGFRFTALYRGDGLWMSDTPAERRDHYPAILAARDLSARRALVNGLGLGMVVQGLLNIPTIGYIDVVEIDPDVIALVGDHYRGLAESLGKTVKIHQHDAYTITWPREARWDIAWSDIWKDACTSNLPEMTRLSRKYARRVVWHGHWLRDELLEQRRLDRIAVRRSAAFMR